MTLHKHWSAPAHADEAPTEVVPAAVASTAPQIVWVAIYRNDCDNDPVVRVYPTKSDCEAWREECAREDYDEWDDDNSEDYNVDAYFDDTDASFDMERHTVKPYNG